MAASRDIHPPGRISPGRVSAHTGASLVRWKDKILRAALQPVAPYSAAAFRIIFGLLGLAAVLRFAAKGWISQLYIEPVHHLSYYGFGWVQPWPGWGMYLHFGLLALASLGVALGYRYRLSVIAFFLLFTYVELIDRTTYLNHYYLVSLLSFIMIFLPLNRAWSLDSLRGRSAGVPLTPPKTIPRAALWALMAQLGLVYFFAGLAKLNPDWLGEAQPLRIWLYNSADLPVIGPLLKETWTAYALSWAGMAFDLTIVAWLLWSKTRIWAYGALAAFHLATAFLFPALGMFPWIMIGLTLVFFRPDWPNLFIDRVRRAASRQALPEACHVPSPPPASASISSASTRSASTATRLAFVLAALFIAVQVALPLRHFAYPGNVRWNEEGYLFSWRVMLTEKMGDVSFRVSGLAGDRVQVVHPEEYLTPGQTERMAYQPDLILAAAHIIRDDFAADGHPEVQVRADAWVSYNGRAAAPLIDPNIDLASIPAGPGPRTWVLGPPENRG